MNKKQFIALADMIRAKAHSNRGDHFNLDQIHALADFCQSQNPAFNRARWIGYITGTCGPNGGKIKP